MANGYLYVYFMIEWCEKAENINKKITADIMLKYLLSGVASLRLS